jgi:hypothetical protein
VDGPIDLSQLTFEDAAYRLLELDRRLPLGLSAAEAGFAVG